MGELVHTSKVKLIRDEGPVRRAYIEHFDEPVYYGVHTAIANFYGVEPAREYPATLDHMIAAIGGWLAGTFGGALGARGVKVAPGELQADIEGDIEKVERTMRITEIRVKYHLPLNKEDEETANRVLEIHPAGCPAHQSVKDSIRFRIEADYRFR